MFDLTYITNISQNSLSDEFQWWFKIQVFNIQLELTRNVGNLNSPQFVYITLQQHVLYQNQNLKNLDVGKEKVVSVRWLQILLGKWLEITISIQTRKWLFRVPGTCHLESRYQLSGKFTINVFFGFTKTHRKHPFKQKHAHFSQNPYLKLTAKALKKRW